MNDPVIGTAAIEIKTNAQKAQAEMQQFSKTSLIGLGAVGGVAGMLGLSIAGIGAEAVRNMPTVQGEISKLADSFSLLSLNTDQAMTEITGFDKSLGDLALEYAQNRTFADLLSDITSLQGLTQGNVVPILQSIIGDENTRTKIQNSISSIYNKIKEIFDLGSDPRVVSGATPESIQNVQTAESVYSRINVNPYSQFQGQGQSPMNIQPIIYINGIKQLDNVSYNQLGG